VLHFDLLELVTDRLREEQSIEVKHIDDISGVVPDDVIALIVAKCQRNSYEELQAAVEEAMANGYSATQMLIQVRPLWCPPEANQDVA
jgi:hypothetical protein